MHVYKWKIKQYYNLCLVPFAGYLLFSALFLKLHLLFDKKIEKMSQSISSPKAEEVVSVDVSQAKTLLQSGYQYLDVR